MKNLGFLFAIFMILSVLFSGCNTKTTEPIGIQAGGFGNVVVVTGQQQTDDTVFFSVRQFLPGASGVSFHIYQDAQGNGLDSTDYIIQGTNFSLGASTELWNDVQTIEVIGDAGTIVNIDSLPAFVRIQAVFEDTATVSIAVKQL